MIGLKIFVVAVGIYGGVRLAGIAIEWLKLLFEELRPTKRLK